MAAGLPGIAGEYLVYFNSMTDGDQEVAREFGVPFCGQATNSGIYGGFRAIVEHAKHPLVLILENDCVCVSNPHQARECLEACAADMETHSVPVFSLTSRRQPGEGNVGLAKYVRAFGVVDPLTSTLQARQAKLADKLYMLIKHGDLNRFRGHAVMVEKEPQAIQSGAIKRLPSGSYLTSSRFRNWGNRAVLVKRSFFLDVLCPRIDKHPDPRLNNGFQDIEKALNRNWWRRLNVPMGSAAEGIFAHERVAR